MPEASPATIIGAGRVGLALAERSPIPCPLLRRGDDWRVLDGPPGQPIVLAVPNDALADVVARVPEARRPDLVFVQNGVLGRWLREHGLDACTRGLLYFAVPRRGAPIEPGGTSVFNGPHAGRMVAWFAAMALPAAAVARDVFAAAALEKTIWNTAFGLLCERFACPVGQVVERHGDALAALASELAAVGRAAAGVDLEPAALTERLASYARSIPDYRGAVKDWPWRNGWFVAAAAEHDVAAPVHAELLRAVGR
jgi:ketopantoate reductase